MQRTVDTYRSPHLRCGLIIGWLATLSAGAAAQGSGQPVPSAPQPAAEQPAAPDPKPVEATRFFDTVTVSATLSPAAIRDTPGTVSVIDAETIERRLIENVADLVKFEPGVYIDANVTRVGLNGFNIRGVGGNRVMTRVDGVVSFFTKDPSDYLADRSHHIGGKMLFDGRAEDTSGNVVVAVGGARVQASLFASYAGGHEMRNRGGIESADATRTAPNPQDRDNTQVLGKVTVSPSAGNRLRGTFELADNQVETISYSSNAVTVTGPIVTNVSDVVSDDTMQRARGSLDQQLDGRFGLNYLFWNVYAQTSDTGQVVDERRLTSGAGPPATILRSGTLDYDQQTIGGSAQARKVAMLGRRAVLLTLGGNYKRDVFDMIRDRRDVNAVTGAVVPPSNIILPSKYFPKSHVGEGGAYLQAETELGRLKLIPGVRYDRFTLDADENDRVYIDNENPLAADFSAGRVSARVGAAYRLANAVTLVAQYAGGFRAPAYSAVNSGFTNLAGGYTSIPNTSLKPETSDNFETGLRAGVGRVSFGVTTFANFYDDFILQVSRGANPATGLLEFQYQNVSQVNMRGLELQGDARLTRTLRLRAAYTIIRGDDVSGADDVAVNTVAPDQGTVGLQYGNPSNRWGGELLLRGARGQRPEVAGPAAFAPAAFAVSDLTGWAAPTRDLTLRAGVLNLTNAKYFEWSNVRGRQSADPVIDRYSSPGVSGIVSLSYGW